MGDTPAGAPDAKVEATDVRAVHAGVLPSVLVRELRRPFETSAGSVRPDDLLDWARGHAPNQSVADGIRAQAVARLRVGNSECWHVPTRVRLAPGWERAVEVEQMLRVQLVCRAHAASRFEDLSITDIRSAARTPLPRVVEMLARLERHYWTPEDALLSRQMRKEPAADRHVGLATTRTPVALTDALRELVQRALTLPWVDAVAADDMRLAGPTHATPAVWMRQQLASAEFVSPYLEPVAQRICAADTMTYAEEVRAIAEMLVRRCHPAPSPEKSPRWVGMLCARFVSDGPGRTLEAIGEEYGLTRERVRQVCESQLQAWLDLTVATPALDRVFRMAARVAPLGLEDLNAQLVRQLGEGVSIESAFELAQALGRTDLPVRIGKLKVRIHGAYEEAPVVESCVPTTWPQAALRIAHGECQTLGCTNILRVAGRLALEEGVAPGGENIVSVVSTGAGFRWLEESGGWFTIGDTNGCGAATRLKKMFAVATEAVGVDSVAEAFAADTRWFRDNDDRAMAIPPTHVILAMAAGWPWVTSRQSTRLLPVEPIDLDVLTAPERAVVQLIEQHGGAAAAWQMYEKVTADLGVSKMAVAFVLATSPALVRFERGVYTVRGRRVSLDAIDAARTRLAQRAGTIVPGGGVRKLGATSWSVGVTAAKLVNEQYAVPEELLPRLAGRKIVPIENAEGVLSVGALGAMRGINRHFKDLQAGDRVSIELLADGAVRLEKLAREPDGQSEAPTDA